MWKKTTGWLFEVQNRNGILEEKDRRLYEYAYGVLLGRVAIYLIFCINLRKRTWHCNGELAGDASLFIALYCSKAVCRRDSFRKSRELHGCFQYPCPSVRSVSGVWFGCDVANTDHMACCSWSHICYGTGGCQQ